MRVGTTTDTRDQPHSVILAAGNDDERLIITFLAQIFTNATPLQIQAMADSIRIGEQKKQRRQ